MAVDKNDNAKPKQKKKSEWKEPTKVINIGTPPVNRTYYAARGKAIFTPDGIAYVDKNGMVKNGTDGQLVKWYQVKWTAVGTYVGAVGLGVGGAVWGALEAASTGANMAMNVAVGAGVGFVPGLVIASVATAVTAIIAAVTEATWEEQEPCSAWCKKQADLAPWLRFGTIKNHTVRPWPYHLINRGIVVGRAPTCNTDIKGTDYCSQGCSVGGTQLPCTLVRKDYEGVQWPQGYMYTTPVQSRTKPEVMDVMNTYKTPVLENTGDGCWSYDKYCCCMDPTAIEWLDIDLS